MEQRRGCCENTRLVLSHHIVALTETLSTTGVLSSDRTWISVARKNSIGRPSGGLAIELSDAVAWREKTCFLSNSIIAVDTVRFVFCVCYFQPKTAIGLIDIIDDFTRALSSISPCTKPLLVCGDFNCRLKILLKRCSPADSHVYPTGKR